jgi:hypothetical protein
MDLPKSRYINESLSKNSVEEASSHPIAGCAVLHLDGKLWSDKLEQSSRLEENCSDDSDVLKRLMPMMEDPCLVPFLPLDASTNLPILSPTNLIQF